MRKLASWTLSVVFLVCLSASTAAAAPAERGMHGDRPTVAGWFDGWVERIVGWVAGEDSGETSPGSDDEAGNESSGDGDDDGSGSADPNG